jgi:hypothetical protein
MSNWAFGYFGCIGAGRIGLRINERYLSLVGFFFLTMKRLATPWIDGFGFVTELRAAEVS